jgi:hypothetical protein
MDELDADTITSPNANENTNFYNFIVQLTKTVIPQTHNNILKKDSDAILDLIINGYRENIRLAASAGRNIAYLCIYLKDSKYQKSIPIHDFIEMSDKIKEKFDEFQLEPVLTRVKKILTPFTVRVRTLQECSELQCYNFDIKENNIIVISVSWE